MATTQPRIQVTLDKALIKALTQHAAAESSSLSATAAQLIREALELHEDRVLSKRGDQRLKTAKKWLTHRDVWGDA